MSGRIYQGSHLVAQTNDAPLGFEDKGIELESLAQYEQLEKDGNLQEDVNYYIKDAKLVMRNGEKYGTSINDLASSFSTTYSSAKIEEINTQVWSGTTSEFEALDKTTLKDGQVVNITDDYDEPTASFAKFPSLKVSSAKALKITRNREVSGILKICDVYGNIYLAGIGDRVSRFYMKCLLNDIPSSKNIATFDRNTTAMFIYSTPYPFFLLEVLGDLSYEIIEKDDIPTDATTVAVDNI